MHPLSQAMILLDPSKNTRSLIGSSMAFVVVLTSLRTAAFAHPANLTVKNTPCYVKPSIRQNFTSVTRRARRGTSISLLQRAVSTCQRIRRKDNRTITTQREAQRSVFVAYASLPRRKVARIATALRLSVRNKTVVASVRRMRRKAAAFAFLLSVFLQIARAPMAKIPPKPLSPSLVYLTRITQQQRLTQQTRVWRSLPRAIHSRQSPRLQRRHLLPTHSGLQLNRHELQLLLRLNPSGNASYRHPRLTRTS